TIPSWPGSYPAPAIISGLTSSFSTSKMKARSCLEVNRQPRQHACPLWVISGHQLVAQQCPLYPQKRTESLQTKLQTNCAAQFSTSHSKMGWSQPKCPTTAAAWLRSGTGQHENLRTRKPLHG